MDIKRKLLYRFKLHYDKDNIIDLNKNLNDINYEELYNKNIKFKEFTIEEFFLYLKIHFSNIDKILSGDGGLAYSN